MKIRCPKCKAVSNVDAAKIPPQGARVRCPRCKTRFLLKRKSKPGSKAGRIDPAARPEKGQKPGVKTCQNCRTLMGADAVIHFFGGRLLCEKCYASAKESAMKIQAAKAADMVHGTPMDLSFLPEGGDSRPPVRTVRINWTVFSIVTVIALFVVGWSLIYYSQRGLGSEVAPQEPIYLDGDQYYLFRAYDFAKKIVVREQRVPSQAAWPSADPIEDYVGYLGEQRYEVRSWYEFSINQELLFRQHFIFILKRVGDTWEKESLTYHSGR